ncbi:MAG: DUF1570 domain-containing protein [Pirellula sp.]|jgi:hypothetical protein
MPEYDTPRRKYCSLGPLSRANGFSRELLTTGIILPHQVPYPTVLSGIALSFAVVCSSHAMGQEQAAVDRASFVQASAAPEKSNPSWPASWSAGWLQVHTTTTDQQLATWTHRLTTLPIEIEQALAIKLENANIRLVVLANETEFDHYLKKNFPGLPKRRALFVQNRGPGLVFTYMHSDWLTDARHECTHALLHASGIKLPLWLDEGLAEYFEVESTEKGSHPTHRHAVESQLRYGQVVQIEDFEQNQNATTLSPKEYRDAWSIVAFLLNHNEESKNALRAYIEDLRTGAAAGLLSRRLPAKSRSEWRDNYLQFFRSQSTGNYIGTR